MDALPLLAAFARQFINRASPYTLQQRDGTYRWVRQILTVEDLASHLAGDITIAISSSDASGCTRWACLDADAADGLAQLVRLREGFADLGWPSVVEASRRGGHLWFLFDALHPVVVVRRAILGVLHRLDAPRLELYPDGAALGHAVRLPLGIHRQTGQRYPFIGSDGQPLRFTSIEGALAWLLAQPMVPGRWLHAHWEPENDPPSDRRPISGTTSAVIRWVDTEISPLDLLAEMAPATAMRRVGRGYLGWCPFHPDAAPQADGSPGSPSFYVVNDRVFGWSWRCLSSNCPWHDGPMQHAFRLFCELRRCNVRQGIILARERWPEMTKGE